MSRRKQPRSVKYPQLTERQEVIYDFLREHMRNHPFPPTVREIAEHIGARSTSTVQYALDALVENGFLKRESGKMRSLALNDKARAETIVASSHLLPLLGTVAAGAPIIAEENINEYVPVPSAFYTGTEPSFILEVRGDSMINAGIFDGDFILVAQQDAAENGEIVVALIDDEATVKRYFHEGDHIRLQPENSEMEPIILYQDIKIIGKVVGLYRSVLR